MTGVQTCALPIFGWQPEEFEGAGVPFRGRGARLDDTLRACRALWRDAPASFESATVRFRERDADISFVAARCTSCGQLHFPKQRVCYKCFEKDAWEPFRLSDKQGTLLAYTFDYFFPTPQPPTVVGIVDVDGARVHMQLVNCPPEEARTGLPLEFEFRRIHQAGGRPNYYWKATPRSD